MAELPAGTVFAGHRIEGVAGRGGMGVVYRATHIALDHPVALKVIAPEMADDPKFRERFVRESRAAVSIRHPNVVQVRHAGEEDGVLFVTMDYIEGSDLRALIAAERRVEPRRTAAIVAQVAAALDAAHQLDLVHRDVKPGNVLIEDRNGIEHVYLTDFGLTRRMSGATELTASGAFIGTLEYVAPEQIRGGELDARTDVYALAGVAFTALTGEPPFGRVDGDVAKLYAHLNDPAPRASERAPGVPPAVDRVLERALAKAPDDRYPTAGALGEALTEAVTGGASIAGAAAVGVPTEELAPPAEPTTEPVTAPQAAELPPTEPTERPEPPGPSPARRQLLGALAGLAAVAIGVGVYALVSGGDDPPLGNGNGQGEAVGSPVDIGTFAVGVTANEDRIVVADRSGGEIVLLNGAEGRELDRVTTPSEPESVFAGQTIVWVANRSGSVSRFQLEGDTLAAHPNSETITLGGTPQDVMVSDQAAWVTNSENDTVTRIKPTTGETGQPIDVGDEPYGVDFDEATDAVWVVNRGSNDVTVIDRENRDDVAAGSVVGDPVPVGTRPKAVVIAEGSAWVTNTDDNTVSRIDTQDPFAEGAVTTIGRGEFDTPRDIAAGFGSIWVTNGGDGSVTRIDPGPGPGEEAFERIDVGGTPEGIAVGAEFVWVALGETGDLVPIEPGR